METSEARKIANQANAQKSTGPKTAEGKEASRQNALKHGLTGAGVVLTSEDSAEVEQRYQAFRDELQPTGAIGLTLVRRAATLAVRMEKCAERDLENTTTRVAQALAEFEAPEGLDAAEVARLRADVARQATFDVSKEACLARGYESAAERGFYRALKEFRQVEKEAKATQPEREAETLRNELGSFLEMSRHEADSADDTLSPRIQPLEPYWMASPSPSNGRVDVPITIGRAR